MKIQLLFIKSESDKETKTFIIKNLNYKILDFIKNKISKSQKITKEYIDFIKIYIMKKQDSIKPKYDVFIDYNYNLDMYISEIFCNAILEQKLEGEIYYE